MCSSASLLPPPLRSPNQFPSSRRGRVLIPLSISITGLPDEALAVNYAPLELHRLNRMACQTKPWRRMAERVGFEPTSPFGRTAFRERRLKPLGNLSDYLKQIKTIDSFFNPSYLKTGTNLKWFVPEGGMCSVAPLLPPPLRVAEPTSPFGRIPLEAGRL